MSELVFCCPNCLVVGHSGAIVDEHYARAFPRSRLHVVCETCDTDSSIPMIDFVLANPFPSETSIAVR